MIINLLSGINPSAVRADDTEHFSKTEVTKDNGGGIKMSEKVSNYTDGTFNVEMAIEGDEQPTTEI